MNKHIPLFVGLVAVCLVSFKRPGLTVKRTFTDAQIERVEHQAFKWFKSKIDIRVISRNEKNEITNLELVRYGADGTPGGSCSSDKFGVLIVTKDGCRIADLGYESKLAALGRE